MYLGPRLKVLILEIEHHEGGTDVMAPSKSQRQMLPSACEIVSLSPHFNGYWCGGAGLDQVEMASVTQS